MVNKPQVSTFLNENLYRCTRDSGNFAIVQFFDEIVDAHLFGLAQVFDVVLEGIEGHFLHSVEMLGSIFVLEKIKKKFSALFDYLNLEKAMPVSVVVNAFVNKFASFIHLSAFFNVIVVPSD